MPYSGRGGPRRKSGPRKFGGQRKFSGPRRFSGPRKMYKITCAECGKEAEVPFKPSGDRPVYCRECFMKRKGIKPRKEEETEKPAEESKE